MSFPAVVAGEFAFQPISLKMIYILIISSVDVPGGS